jgi:ADP-heptose:LPS heptosyltransferase
MGDVLRTLPPVRILRHRAPEARIFWIVDERWESLLSGHADIDGVMAVPRRQWTALARSPLRWPVLIASVGRFTAAMRAIHPNLVLDFHAELRSGMLGWLSRAEVRLGYAGHQQKEGNFLFTTYRVDAGPRRRSRMERNLDLIRALGLAVDTLPDGGLEPRPTVIHEAEELVGACFGLGARYAVLCPGASSKQAYKKPPAPLLARAARSLADRAIGALVAYGPGEEPDARRVVESSRGAAVLAPPTSISLLAELLRRASVLVSGDTGPLHLACAVSCPVLGLYGPTDPVVNAPWGVPNIVLSPPGRVYTGIKRIDRESGGFDGLTEDAVDSGLRELLDMTRNRR